MELEKFLESCPDYAKDLKLNLSSVLRQVELTDQQIWGTAVCSSITARNAEMTEVILVEAEKYLSPQALNGAKAAAAVMGMNNIFYRFRHLSRNPKYSEIPARLRMQVIRSHGTDPLDFELWCLAVSAINGCGVCVESHEKVLRDKGVKEETILAAVRIASVIHALAGVMAGESVTAPVAV